MLALSLPSFVLARASAEPLATDCTAAIASVALDLDVLLWPERALSDIASSGAKPQVGGGLTEAVWAGSAAVPQAGAALLYGAIPAAATPETVLSITRALQA